MLDLGALAVGFLMARGYAAVTGDESHRVQGVVAFASDN
jgi:hypothetical protein